ncbi:MAG TPA: alpha/beta fold hydrolase [Actinopolymorphaceae bacterium]|jgi:pimeloyl-ACP methyl ester carboxylesterase
MTAPTREAAASRSTTVALAGHARHGESALCSPHIPREQPVQGRRTWQRLSTHVQDVIGIIEHHDLHDVTLVCHSYGGMVIACVADRIPERIAHLVWLNAMLPSDGQSCLDSALGAAELHS